MRTVSFRQAIGPTLTSDELNAERRYRDSSRDGDYAEDRRIIDLMVQTLELQP